jgi:hypothetical protein
MASNHNLSPRHFTFLAQLAQAGKRTDHLLLLIRRALEYRTLQKEVPSLRSVPSQAPAIPGIVGHSLEQHWEVQQIQADAFTLHSKTAPVSLLYQALGIGFVWACLAVSSAHISAAATAIGMAVRLAKPMQESYLILRPTAS